jgi:hypothetical protein
MPTHLLPIPRTLGRVLAQRTLHVCKALAVVHGNYLGGKGDALNPQTRSRLPLTGQPTQKRIDRACTYFQWVMHGVKAQVKVRSPANISKASVCWLKRFIGRDLFLAFASPLVELYRTLRYTLNAHVV